MKKVHRCRIILVDQNQIKETIYEHLYYITKTKNKHLNFSQYEFIINSLIQFNAQHKGCKRNIGKTQFIKSLASSVGTSVSNVYSIIKDATITVKDTYLKEHTELSAMAAFLYFS